MNIYLNGQQNRTGTDGTIEPAYFANILRGTSSEMSNEELQAYIKAIVGDDVPASAMTSASAFEEWLHTKGWTLKDLSAVIMSGGAAITSPITATRTVGGVSSGKTYDTGTLIEVIIKDILSPRDNPALTAPSVTLTCNKAKLQEIGTSLTATFTATFSRGSISPAYGTSGYRSGAATSYKLNSGATQSSNTFTNITVNETNKTFTTTVAYAAGEQPKDSSGNNYSSALPAGTVTSQPFEFEFVNALYADLDCDGTIEKLPLISKADKETILSFGYAAEDKPETFDIPETLTGIQILVENPFSQTWDDCSSDFRSETVVKQDAAGRNVNYTRYIFDLGYNVGPKDLKIKWD